MAYRIALAGATGPFVGPWICSVGTEYAIEVSGAAVLELELHDHQITELELSPQQHPFPANVSRYRIRLDTSTLDRISARVYLR